MKTEAEILKEIEGSEDWYKAMCMLRPELRGRINALMWVLGYSEEKVQKYWTDLAKNKISPVSTGSGTPVS